MLVQVSLKFKAAKYNFQPKNARYLHVENFLGFEIQLSGSPVLHALKIPSKFLFFCNIHRTIRNTCSDFQTLIASSIDFILCVTSFPVYYLEFITSSLEKFDVYLISCFKKMRF
jgi:hypothetical protein